MQEDDLDVWNDFNALVSLQVSFEMPYEYLCVCMYVYVYVYVRVCSAWTVELILILSVIS
jgi:hypothetical protein